MSYELRTAGRGYGNRFPLTAPATSWANLIASGGPTWYGDILWDRDSRTQGNQWVPVEYLQSNWNLEGSIHKDVNTVASLPVGNVNKSTSGGGTVTGGGGSDIVCTIPVGTYVGTGAFILTSSTTYPNTSRMVCVGRISTTIPASIGAIAAYYGEILGGNKAYYGYFDRYNYQYFQISTTNDGARQTKRITTTKRTFIIDMGYPEMGFYRQPEDQEAAIAWPNSWSHGAATSNYFYVGAYTNGYATGPCIVNIEHLAFYSRSP